jgi:SET domain-containing protein
MKKNKLFIVLSATAISIGAVTPVIAKDLVSNFTGKENITAFFLTVEGIDDGKTKPNNPKPDNPKPPTQKDLQSENSNFQNQGITMIDNSYQGRQECDPRYDYRCR